MDLIKLDKVLTACNVVRRHLAKFPYEPISFDKVELSYFKSSIKAACNAAHIIKNDLYFLEHCIQDGILAYLEFCLDVDDQPYSVRRELLGRNRELDGLLRMAVSYRASRGWRTLGSHFELTEDNIDLLSDVERLIAAPLNKRYSAVMRFKLRWSV